MKGNLQTLQVLVVLSVSPSAQAWQGWMSRSSRIPTVALCRNPSLAISHYKRISKECPSYYFHNRCYYSQQNSNDTQKENNASATPPQAKNMSSASFDYKRPQFSDAFKKHMEQVMNAFDGDDNGEGIDCTGEPSMDPSRMVMDNGLDSEYLCDFFETNKVVETTRKDDKT